MTEKNPLIMKLVGSKGLTEILKSYEFSIGSASFLFYDRSFEIRRLFFSVQDVRYLQPVFYRQRLNHELRQ